MAKKKRRRSKTSRKKKFSKETLYEAREIVDEIVQTMKDTLAGLVPAKQFSRDALPSWKAKLLISVATNLDLGQSWDIDKHNVLAVATDMSVICGLLAADGSVVNRSRTEAAFMAVKTHARCPGAGGGAWCDFNVP